MFRVSARPKTSSGRARALVAAPLLGIVIAGCGTSGSNSKTTSVTATGTTLRIYLSDPPAVQKDQALQDIVDAEQLAFTQESNSVKGVSLKLVTLKDTVSNNARKAIENNSMIAYLGEIQTGQSRQTVGILNAEDALEFSATDTVVPGKNDFESFSTYGRTFASIPIDLTTSSTALAKAVPTFAKAFTSQDGHAPSAQAINGYDAMWILLRVINYLGNSANDRSKVTADTIATLKGNKGQASVPAFTIKK